MHNFSISISFCFVFLFIGDIVYSLKKYRVEKGDRLNEQAYKDEMGVIQDGSHANPSWI